MAIDGKSANNVSPFLVINFQWKHNMAQLKFCELKYVKYFQRGERGVFFRNRVA